jgi:hypothetical protein
MIGMSEQSPPQRVSFRENSCQQTNQANKQCLLIFLLEIWDCKSFVQNYLTITEILSAINSRESGIARMLQSDAVVWFQRYPRSDLRLGSILLARQIDTTIVKKVVPFGESCPGTHTGYRIFLS